MTEIKEPVYATERERIREAYCEMADKANYRPAAPGDGFGDISLTEDELNDHNRLAVESAQYADQFLREENSLQFRVGISNWDTNRAPRRAEMEALKSFHVPPGVKKLLHIWKDRQSTPTVRELKS